MQCGGGWGEVGKEKMKEDGIGRETNYKRLNLTKQTEGCWGEAGREKMVGLWTFGRACAIVSAVKCISLMIHRPVPLGLIIHYMFIKKLKKCTGTTDLYPWGK